MHAHPDEHKPYTPIGSSKWFVYGTIIFASVFIVPGVAIFLVLFLVEDDQGARWIFLGGAVSTVLIIGGIFLFAIMLTMGMRRKMYPLDPLKALASQTRGKLVLPVKSKPFIVPTVLGQFQGYHYRITLSRVVRRSNAAAAADGVVPVSNLVPHAANVNSQWQIPTGNYFTLLTETRARFPFLGSIFGRMPINEGAAKLFNRIVVTSGDDEFDQMFVCVVSSNNEESLLREALSDPERRRKITELLSRTRPYVPSLLFQKDGTLYRSIFTGDADVHDILTTMHAILD